MTTFSKEIDMKKRLLFMLILCIGLVAVFTACSCSDEEYWDKTQVDSVNGLYITLDVNGDYYTVTGVADKSASTYAIPAEYKGKPITAIGDGAFNGCTAMTEITLPSKVESIGKDAFKDCISLYSVTLPASLKAIKDGAFDNCGKLIDVCNQSSLSIVAGASTFGGVAANAISVHASPADKSYGVVDGYVIYESQGKAYILGYNGTGTELTLPSDKAYTLYKGAFDRSNITSVSIPASVTLSEGCFANCASLKTVSLANGIVAIPKSAFSGCVSLDAITIPGTVASIGSDATSFSPS